MDHPTLVAVAGSPASEDRRGHVVRVTGLRKRYGGREAVRGIDLVVHPGEIYGLIGADGVGKSTVIRSIAGTLAFDGGNVEVFGVRVDSERAADRVKGRLGYMPQGLGQNLYPELSVEENIEFFARLRSVSAADLALRKPRLLAVTRLDRALDRPMKHLSGGMKQKLGLVCTLIHEPDLVLLDEPTTGVDPVSRQDFWEILSRLARERNVAIVVSTSYLEESGYMDRLSIMLGGRVLGCGTQDELIGLVPGTVLSGRGEPARRLLEAANLEGWQVETSGDAVRAFVPDTHPSAPLSGSPLETEFPAGVSREAPTLDDVVVALIRRERQDPQHPPHQANHENPARTRESAILVQARALSRDFGAFRAVAGVTFEIREGEIFGLLGANGAGKTTVIKLLIGLLTPTGGTCTILNADPVQAGRAIREGIGYMSQAFSLYPDLTAEENLRLSLGIYGLPRRERADRLRWVTALTDLDAHRSSLTRSLPLGVRQRLALGCALVHRPRLLFLDEPTSGVDALGRRRFWEALQTLARLDGVAMLVTTHHMSEAEHCDRLALMHAGSIVAQGSPLELKHAGQADAGTPMSIGPGDALSALAALRAEGLRPSLLGNRLRLFSHDPEADAARISAALQRQGLVADEPRREAFTLDDVFVLRIRALERAAAGAPR